MQLEPISSFHTGETVLLLRLLAFPGIFDIPAPVLCQTHDAPTVCWRLQLKALLMGFFLYRAFWALARSGK